MLEKILFPGGGGIYARIGNKYINIRVLYSVGRGTMSVSAATIFSNIQR
jgi:hypothetical protein